MSKKHFDLSQKTHYPTNRNVKNPWVFILICFSLVLIGLSLQLLLFQEAPKSPLLTPLTTSPIRKLTTIPINPPTGGSPTPMPKPRQLSLDEIFTYHDPSASPSSDPGEYTLIATGDVIPARSVNSKMVTLNNFIYPFEKTASFLHNADLVFINLESPLVPGCKATLEGMVFCGDERSVDGLVFAGVSVASLANNHLGNYGVEGVTNTVRILKEKNIDVTGLGLPAIKTIKGKKFGFLGYNDIGVSGGGIAQADTEKMRADIAILRPTVDFLIVTFHWGVEYVSGPTQRQRELAHVAIDAGADVIIGNHPHWVQGIEEYKSKFITYAHGNYVFDQMWSQETREGVLGKYVFDKEGLQSVTFYPVIIDDYSQPRFATKTEAEKILGRMKTSSEKIRNVSVSE